MLIRLAAISCRNRTNRSGGMMRMCSSSSILKSSVESYRVMEGCPWPVETLLHVNGVSTPDTGEDSRLSYDVAHSPGAQAVVNVLLLQAHLLPRKVLGVCGLV